MEESSSSMWRSSVGRKFLMAVTGLGLFIFVAVHLLENLVLLFGDRAAYNSWTHTLERLGPALYVIELGLLLFFLVHIVSGVEVWLEKRRARPRGYRVARNAGGRSRKTLSSVSMIATGGVLLAFLVVHVSHFKYGPGLAEGYVQPLGGETVRDLHRLVVETFSRPGWAVGYAAVMVLLGLHLRHGFWSAFQSLGAAHPRFTPFAYGLGVVLAVLIGLGFLVLPVWLYFHGGAA